MLSLSKHEPGRLLLRVGGACGVAGGVVLLVYLFWNLFVAPPSPSEHAFLQFAAASPWVAFFDDWLLLSWFLLTIVLVLAVNQKLATVARDEATLASVLGLVGLGLGIARSAFNIGRLQVLAAHFGDASEAERETLARLLRWTEQGDVARNLALVLIGGWVLWVGSLGLRSGAFPRWLGWLGVAAGLSVAPALVGFLVGVPFLTSPGGYLAVILVLWMVWSGAVGAALLRS